MPSHSPPSLRYTIRRLDWYATYIWLITTYLWQCRRWFPNLHFFIFANRSWRLSEHTTLLEPHALTLALWVSVPRNLRRAKTRHLPPPRRNKQLLTAFVFSSLTSKPLDYKDNTSFHLIQHGCYTVGSLAEIMWSLQVTVTEQQTQVK